MISKLCKSGVFLIFDVFIRAANWFIAINRIQNKSLFTYYMCVLCICIMYCIYKYKHIYIYFKKYMYIFILVYHLYNI